MQGFRSECKLVDTVRRLPLAAVTEIVRIATRPETRKFLYVQFSAAKAVFINSAKNGRFHCVPAARGGIAVRACRI
jgi:hypothetical protein